jgi:hypothetical protein
VTATASKTASDASHNQRLTINKRRSGSRITGPGAI